MDKRRQDKCFPNKCHHDRWNLFKLVKGTLIDNNQSMKGICNTLIKELPSSGIKFGIKYHKIDIIQKWRNKYCEIE